MLLSVSPSAGLQFGDYENDTCLSVKRINKTVIGNVYEGIPETIVLNLITWCCLLVLFAALRNRAWDYGRLALVQSRDGERWTQIFYKNTDDAVPAEEQLHEGDVSLNDVGCSWFPSIFKINKSRIFARCGPDAAQYLSFQRHLIVVMAIITFCSIVIILPVNFQGTLQGTAYTFGHTTISNLEPTSLLLWTHVFVSFLFVPIIIVIMQRCARTKPMPRMVSSRTVMITHISTTHRNTEDIRNYFAVRYPNIEIRDVQIAYRIKHLMSVEKQRSCAHDAKSYCYNNNKLDMKVQPYGCVVCCPWQTQNALDYYTKEEEKLVNKVIQERNKALRQPLGIAFVTLNREEDAKFIIDTFQPGTLRNWNMVKSSSPSDLNWENLEISTRHWYSKAVIINTILFLLLFFLTTPAIIVNMVNTYTTAQENFIKHFSPVLAEFLPTLLLLSVSALLPVIVAYSGQWMSHWTKSHQNLEVLHKTYFFLLFMVLILPSLGLTSAQAFLDWSLQADNKTVRWECIFLPDKGAFFVNYVITSALIGTGMELLRFPELAMYVWRLLLMKSSAEKITIRKEILSVFPFGIHYAWTLLIFTVCTVYSLTCPLITPFGILYLSLKHLVDKHNIYYVYRPITMSGEGQQIHGSAIKLVRVAIALLQLIMTAFAVLRGSGSSLAIATMFSSAFTVGLFFLQGPAQCCQRTAGGRTATSVNNSDYHEMQETYIAPVLVSSQNLGAIERSVISQSVYGTSNVPHGIGVRTVESPPTGSSTTTVISEDGGTASFV